MKKLLVPAAVVACFAFYDAKAQNVDGVRLSDIHSDYIEAKAVYDGNDMYTIRIEYGQKVKRLKDLTLRDDNGKEMLFNSALDFVNKTKTYGYELFQVYQEIVSKDSDRPVYILKRK